MDVMLLDVISKYDAERSYRYFCKILQEGLSNCYSSSLVPSLLSNVIIKNNKSVIYSISEFVRLIAKPW